MVRKAKTWNIEGLGANGPNPEYSDKLMLFGQFVGDWKIVAVKSPDPSGVAFKSGGEVHFNWILDGRAVQDVWLTYDDKLGKPIAVGTTIRVFDPEEDVWHSTWISGIRHTVQTFKARQVGGDIVLESRSSKDKPERWIFSDINPNSFTWHSEESYDGGKTWVLTEEMKIMRTSQ